MFLSLALAAALTSAAPQPVQTSPAQIEQAQASVSLSFTASDAHAFTEAERAQIEAIVLEAYAVTKADFRQLPDQVAVRVDPISRPIVDTLGGVAGRAERPGESVLELSVTYPGGVSAAAESGLMRAALHEFHHLAHGWTIEGNRFGPGIDIATAVEGLAEAYSEHYEGSYGTYPALDDATYSAWATEVRALPWNADYGQWMFAHPDGREAIGYRTGAELVRRAMARSGLDIIAISAASPEDIWEMAGFERKD